MVGPSGPDLPLARLPPCPNASTLGLPCTLICMQFMQQRGYNAWSPVQRYFVDEQVAAVEANRTLQFTGLDSGACCGRV